MRVRRSPWVDDDVAALKEMAIRFFEREAAPLREKWERQQQVDRAFWLKAGELGILCPGVPAEYGGGGGTLAHDLAVLEAQAWTGEIGMGNQVHTGLVAHQFLAYATEEQKRRWLPLMARGEAIGAVAMTEPGGGSDLKAIRTTAVRDGDHYVVNGSKTFITNGGSADLVILLVRTDPTAASRGMSLLVVDTREAPGFSVGRVLNKVGMKAQDTAELFFDNVRVPVGNLLGVEGQGWTYALTQLAHERLVIAVWGLSVLERAVHETVTYTKERDAYRGKLFDLQNTRFELAECATIAHVARVFIDDCIGLHLAGELDATTASMAKAWVTDMQVKVIDRCVQLFGGYGYMLDYPIARMFIDSRVQTIYVGANEVQKELISRSL